MQESGGIYWFFFFVGYAIYYLFQESLFYLRLISKLYQVEDDRHSEKKQKKKRNRKGKSDGQDQSSGKPEGDSLSLAEV